MATNVDSMPVNEKLNGSNHDLWSRKVQFLLNNGDLVKFLTSTMSTPTDKD